MTNTQRKKQLRGALLHFYENPIAKVSVELFLSIGLILFLGLFAIRPTLLTMSDLLKEIEDKKKLNTQLEQKVAALGTAQNEYRKHESKMYLLDQAVPSQPEIIRNLKILEKTALDNSVILTNLSVSEIPPEENGAVVSENKKDITNLVVNATVTGDYISLRNFVESLGKNRRTILVDSVTFSLTDNSDVLRLSAKTTINFPYYGMKTDAGTAEK